MRRGSRRLRGIATRASAVRRSPARPAARGTAALSAYKIADRATVTLSIYFYGDDAAAAARNEAAWQAWMEGRFP